MVPPALRTWFVIHFVADLAFALPLFFFPREFLGMLGWTEVDPIASRLVAAALVGIGMESLIGRNASRQSFSTMLRLKMMWSSTATIGIGLSIYQGAAPAAWLFLAIFGVFCGIWTWWRIQLG